MVYLGYCSRTTKNNCYLDGVITEEEKRELVMNLTTEIMKRIMMDRKIEDWIR